MSDLAPLPHVSEAQIFETRSLIYITITTNPGDIPQIRKTASFTIFSSFLYALDEEDLQLTMDRFRAHNRYRRSRFIGGVGWHFTFRPETALDRGESQVPV
jgi:hypothetical protein